MAPTDGKASARVFLLGPMAVALLLLGSSAPADSTTPKTCGPPPASPLIVNVKDKGAKGDGKTDETAAIQAAIDAVAGTKGTVLVPDGIYMVDAVRANSLKLGSHMTLKLADNAVLKAFPNASQTYAILTIANASNVWVTGGTLEGERDRHKGKSGEWGMGIHIGKGAKRITVNNLTSKKMWGDGFYVNNAEDVWLCSVVADGNRRQGLSIIDADGLVVSHSVFKNTYGTRPSAGIDLEPDKPSQEITNIRIKYSKFINNAGHGIMITSKKGRVANVTISHNVFERNDRPILIENAPHVQSTAICNNRAISHQNQASQGFNTFAEPTKVVVLQRDCLEGRDLRFEKKRMKKKKKK